MKVVDLATVDAAQDGVEAAALRSITAQHYSDGERHAADESTYASELLALAARKLVRAVDRLPREHQPVGWNDEE